MRLLRRKSRTGMAAAEDSAPNGSGGNNGNVAVIDAESAADQGEEERRKRAMLGQLPNGHSRSPSSAARAAAKEGGSGKGRRGKKDGGEASSAGTEADEQVRGDFLILAEAAFEASKVAVLMPNPGGE